MKKILLSVFFLSGLMCLHAFNSHAQGLGITAGSNFANFNDTDLSTDSRRVFMAGFTFEIGIPLSPISIQPGVLFAQKGAYIATDAGEIEDKLNYIKIPVVARFDILLDNPVFTPNVYAGPYIGFNINADREASSGAVTLTGDIDEEVKSTDYGVVVGAGVDILKFNIGVRYSAGLTDIYEDDPAIGGNAKHGVFSIAVGISL